MKQVPGMMDKALRKKKADLQGILLDLPGAQSAPWKPLLWHA